jgi:23S rRNA (cytosine1962-C5)-methyltransferase
VREARLILKAGREKSVLRKHPWIFSGSVDRILGEPEMGGTVEIYDQQGIWLARAGFSPHSQIIARIWTWNKEEEDPSAYFPVALDRSLRLRDTLNLVTDAYRVVNAENDGLPGIIIDRYGEFLVAQFLTASAEKWKPEILRSMMQWQGVRGGYERSDADVRTREGLPLTKGNLFGEQPPPRIPIREGKWRFLVDVALGHKTGFYLDQRENREIVHRLVSTYAQGGEILNCFSYTGAFAVCALSAGARTVTNIDSSESALLMVQDQLSLNGISTDGISLRTGNVFEVLREYRDGKRQFDLVILDPPKLAHARKDLHKATRAYKDLNWLAMRILRPGGILVTFSCSGLVSEDLFQKVVFSAALDAGRNAQIIQVCGQPSDHPVLLSFPEGKYLKGLVCRVL